ncbi:DUF429 domain-containing protein [Phytoactinopolyspora sp. XMNu-373]|uniref:DUF429 domain-containing protein n=1 Tax=Phytoactinopolyspora mesophila TaxID=2650750 RepID=A0A7K3M037_9ACTN|nr:DUF429 domain-containing protein [Phytoactinopolyspora mesophila]
MIEVHPELCFATLAGHPLTHPKRSWAGAEERRRLLVSAGIHVPTDIGVAGDLAGAGTCLPSFVASRNAWTSFRAAKRYMTPRSAEVMRRRVTTPGGMSGSLGTTGRGARAVEWSRSRSGIGRPAPADGGVPSASRSGRFRTRADAAATHARADAR